MEVIDLRARGVPFKEIAERTSYSISGAKRVVERWENEHSIDNKPRSGRPRKLTEEKISNLIDIAENNPLLPLSDITNASKLNVSVRSVANALREKEYGSFLVPFMQSLPDMTEWEVLEDLSGPHELATHPIGIVSKVLEKDCGLLNHRI